MWQKPPPLSWLKQTIRRKQTFDILIFGDFLGFFGLKIIRGGGLGVKTKFSFVSTHVVALHILFPKWAHLPSNSKRLPRYDSSKLGRFRLFSAICIGKSPKSGSWFSPPWISLSHWVTHLGLKLAWGSTNMSSVQLSHTFLRFWFFGLFWVFLSQIFAKIWNFDRNLEQKDPKKAKKSKSQKCVR